MLIEAVARTQRCDKLAEGIAGLESQLIVTTGFPLEQLIREVDDFADVNHLETAIELLTGQCNELDILRNERAVRVGQLEEGARGRRCVR